MLARVAQVAVAMCKSLHSCIHQQATVPHGPGASTLTPFPMGQGRCLGHCDVNRGIKSKL